MLKTCRKEQTADSHLRSSSTIVKQGGGAFSFGIYGFVDLLRFRCVCAPSSPAAAAKEALNTGLERCGQMGD